VVGYPWEQLIKEFTFNTSSATASADGKTWLVSLPPDWSYFLDQTQWDRTNHWPLLGPKTAQEWQWLKGGILSSGPRIRYRVVSGNFEMFPTDATQSDIAMEYISDRWLQSSSQTNTFYDSAQSDEDVVLLDPWVMTSFVKLKYWEAKGLDTTAYTKDFLGIWEARIGQNKGAPTLTLAPRPRTMLIGVNNIPDGSWNVGGGGTP
jgi:hypothetical protein